MPTDRERLGGMTNQDSARDVLEQRLADVIVPNSGPSLFADAIADFVHATIEEVGTAVPDAALTGGGAEPETQNASDRREKDTPGAPAATNDGDERLAALDKVANELEGVGLLSADDLRRWLADRRRFARASSENLKQMSILQSRLDNVTREFKAFHTAMHGGGPDGALACSPSCRFRRFLDQPA